MQRSSMMPMVLARTAVAGSIVLGCGSDSNQALTHPRQEDLDALAAAVKVTAAVVQNASDGCPSDAAWGLCNDQLLALENTGTATSLRGTALYFSSSHRVLGSGSAQFALSHIEGDLYRLSPSAGFTSFGAGEKKTISLTVEGCVISESQLLPRYYWAAAGLEPRVAQNTDSEDLSSFVAPFTTPEQLKCGAGDVSVLATGVTRFLENASRGALNAEHVVREVIPSPVRVVERDEWLDISRGLSLQTAGLAPATVAELERAFRARAIALGPAGVPVRVSVEPDDAAFVKSPRSEAYRMSVSADSVVIVGADAAGAFYGLQTLLALLPADVQSAPRLPGLEIPYDAPRYGSRGLNVDVVRNFHGLTEIETLLRWMAAYKLNSLHLHLADDEGFRLEIPGLPELTGVGAQRCHDLDEHVCLVPALGSGPLAPNTGSGHFTREEFVHLLITAKALQIEVIPEFDMPGHSRAALRAMAALATAGDLDYRLDDPEDRSSYRSVQGYDDNVANVCLESTYSFIAKLMDEVSAMYRAADAPLRTWHIGADEVPAGVWTRSPRCDAFFSSQNAVKSPNELQAYFLARVSALAQQRGFGLRGYHEGMLKRSGVPEDGFLSPASDLGGNALSTNWSSFIQWFDDAPAVLTNLGYDVVLSSFDYLFWDQAQEADPRERGNPWATRFTDTRRVFGFISGNLAANAQWLAVCAEGACDSTLATATPVTHPERVVGLEAELWSEFIRTDEQLEYMAFPRVLALAERAWHRASWEPADGMDSHAPIDAQAFDADWARFAATMGYKELPKLDQQGVRFRVELPGARIVNGVLDANVAIPGLGIEYEDDTGAWLAYDASAPPRIESTRVRTVTSMGRRSRIATVAP